MKGFIGIGTLAALLIGVVFVAIIISIFAGGATYSTTLLGWTGIPYIESIDIFLTSVYNAFVFISLWLRVGILGVILIGMQVVLIFFYYKLFSYMWQFKDSIKNIIDELLDI